ncbi:MAG: esterase/lipase family protein [Pseudonocardia sp.]
MTGIHRRGNGCVHAINHHPLVDDVRAAAALLGARVDELRERTGAEKVHVVGHSLGGIIARYHVQCLGGHDAVGTVATLGSPHGGSSMAGWLPGCVGRQLRPGSDLLAELAAPAPRCSTRFLVAWSHLDLLMVPRTTARLDHPDLDVEHLELRDVGHAALPFDGRVAHWVAAGLTRPARPPQRDVAVPAA